MTPEAHDMIACMPHDQWGFALYCTIDNARPNVYRELIGVLDVFTPSAFVAKEWEGKFGASLLNHDFVTRTDGKYVHFRTVPIPPYAVKAVPTNVLRSYTGWWDMCETVGLGCPAGDLGTLAYVGRWPKLYDYADDIAELRFKLTTGESYYSAKTSLWYR